MQGLTEVAPPGFGHTKSGKGDEMYECYLDEDFKQFPEKKVSRKIQREKDKLSAGALAGSKASGSQIQGRQQQLNRKRAGRIMKMSRAMNSKTSTSSNERMKMNSSAQKTTRTVDRIKDRQTGSDTSKGRPRRWSLEPKLKDKKESFEIDTSAHNKAKKKAKIRNLAKGNTNPNEKASAERKLGPKLYGEGKKWDSYKKAVSIVLGKKKEQKKPSMDSTTRKLHKWRTDKEQAEREKYVTFTKPVGDD
jgi:hypothetical protein